MCKIFLDDMRQPIDCTSYMYNRIGELYSIYLGDWIVVRNYEGFVDAVTKHIDEITHVSFDHDLSELHYNPNTWVEGYEYDERTGYDCAIWLKHFYDEKKKELPTMFVHSMNPVGTKNIINVFK